MIQCTRLYELTGVASERIVRERDSCIEMTVMVARTAE